MAKRIIGTTPKQDGYRMPAEFEPQQGVWKCACGTENSGNFCQNCGAKKPEAPARYRCNKCGWTPQDPSDAPKFCPQCGDPFDENDRV